MMEVLDDSLTPALVPRSAKVELYVLGSNLPAEVTKFIRISSSVHLQKPTEEAICVEIEELQVKITDSYLCLRPECSRRQDIAFKNRLWSV